MALAVFQASAGSGKTYALAKAYLKIAIRNDYTKILAVTFTNKAAEEMKQRVLDFLIKLSQDKDRALRDQISEELGVSKEYVCQKSQELTTQILHGYSKFHITTIDAFSYAVIRAFFQESGIDFFSKIQLDEELVLNEVSAKMFDALNEDKKLLEWVIQFTRDKIYLNEGYNPDTDISGLGKELFRERFKHKFTNSLNLNKSPLLKLIAWLKKEVRIFEVTLKQRGNRFRKAMDEEGITTANIYKNSNVVGFYKEIDQGAYTKIIDSRRENANFQKAMVDISHWVTKKNTKLIPKLEERIFPQFQEDVRYFDKHLTNYLSHKKILKNIYVVGLYANLYSHLKNYRKENNTLLISDLSDILFSFIHKPFVPIILERTLGRYDHFLIDEFQDTSIFQWNIFKVLLHESLSSGYDNLIVGDVKQSIYSFRGADPTHLIGDMEKNFPHRQSEILEKNYRSSPVIVEFNNHFFSNVSSILVKNLPQKKILKIFDNSYAPKKVQQTAQKKEKKGSVVVDFVTTKKENENESKTWKTVKKIHEILRHGYDPQEITILVRTNSQAQQLINQVEILRREYVEELGEYDYKLLSGQALYIHSSPVVRLIICVFKYLVDREDSYTLYQLIICYQQLKKSSPVNHNFFAFRSLKNLPTLFQSSLPYLSFLPLYELTEAINRLFDFDDLLASGQYAYLHAFQDEILMFLKEHDSNISNFLKWWEKRNTTKNKASLKNANSKEVIQVLTIHKSKGLEFPFVIIPLVDFSLDNTTNKNKSLNWYKTPEYIREKYQDQTHNLVTFDNRLAHTHFKDEFESDVIKNCFENTNNLYVAFTRAEKGLFVYLEISKKAKEDLGKDLNTIPKNPSMLLYKYFLKSNPKEWNLEEERFEIGDSLEKCLTEEAKPKEIKQQSYNPCYKWTDRLHIDSKQSKQEATNKTKIGNLTHEILSEIIVLEDLKKIENEYENGDRCYTPEVYEHSINLVKKILNDSVIKNWFSGNYEVKTEISIMDNNDQVFRIDRLMLKGIFAIIVDFKTGEKKAKDHQQLKYYEQCIQEMGYQTQAYLLYLSPNIEITEI